MEEELAGDPRFFIVGGGDGTIRSVLHLLAGTHHVLGVLPLGTMNRFARALALPLTIQGAIDAFSSGCDRQVNLGEVNGHFFIHTCAFGLYTDLSRLREKRRARHPHWPKLLRWAVDTAASAWRALRSWRLVRFQLRLPEGARDYRVPTILITNDASGAQGAERGVLRAYIPQAVRPLRFVGLLLKAVILGPEKAEPLEVHAVEEMEIHVRHGTRIGLDGEIQQIPPPLRLRCRTAALRVRCPVSPA